MKNLLIPSPVSMESGNMKLLNLYSKPNTYKFSDKEIDFIRKNANTDKWKIHYCLYAKHSPSNRYFGFVVDYMSNNPRNIKPKFYGMNVIHTRSLNTKELEWEFENYGTNNRRFKVYWVSDVHWIIDMDRQYNVETPEHFIEACEKLNKQLINKTL